MGLEQALTGAYSAPMIAPPMTTMPIIDVIQAARRGAVYADRLEGSGIEGSGIDGSGIDGSGVLAPSAASANSATPTWRECLPRLAAEVAGLDALSYRLEFGQDDQRRMILVGDAQLLLRLPCQRCLLERQIELTVALDSVLILAGETVAESSPRADVGFAIGARDVVFIDASETSVAELLEDDLLLALPQQVCADTACENLPPLSYPAQSAMSDSAGGAGQESEQGAGEVAQATQEGSPFDILKQLKVGEAGTPE